MVDEKQAASWSPDDASGLFDNARAIISAVKVDTFKANNGNVLVNLDVTFKPRSGEPVTEHFLVGGADQWTPNAAKTGAIPTNDGGRHWNKSASYRFVKSLTDAGFPSARLKDGDISVIVGSDVQVSRVTEDRTYMDKQGKERQATILLVTKLYAAPGEKASAVTKPATPRTAAPATPAQPAAATSAGDVDIDDYATQVLVQYLGAQKGPVAINKLAPQAFTQATRDKMGREVRNALTERIGAKAFLDGLANEGVITVDGNSVQLAA